MHGDFPFASTGVLKAFSVVTVRGTLDPALRRDPVLALPSFALVQSPLVRAKT